MVLAGTGNCLINRPSEKLHSVMLPEKSSGVAGPFDATILPSGLNDTKLIQLDFSGSHPTPICFTNVSTELWAREIHGTRSISPIRTAERHFMLCFCSLMTLAGGTENFLGSAFTAYPRVYHSC